MLEKGKNKDKLELNDLTLSSNSPLSHTRHRITNMLEDVSRFWKLETSIWSVYYVTILKLASKETFNVISSLSKNIYFNECCSQEDNIIWINQLLKINYTI